MKVRKEVTKELRTRYQKARKKEKRMILDEFCQLTGYNRSYAARTLRNPDPRTKKAKSKKGRGKTYGEETLIPLRKVWAVLDGPCGKRMAPFLSEIVPRLEKDGELRINEDTRKRLLSLSAATIDRKLKPERERLKLKGRKGTKPGTLLKHQIPVRTFSDWNENRPGFLEMDLVAHEGGNPRGDFCQTLDMTDVYSGWTESRAVKNKAQKWVFEALKDIRGTLPFPLLGIDSDNGSEFINHHLIRYAEAQEITFTRSRPSRKNDNCYVEQKNYTVVRKYAGYLRYDTEEELQTLNELYQVLRFYTNFFQPQMKLQEKTRIGSRVIKRYDEAKTPYQRLISSPHLDREAKQELKALYEGLNPVNLKKEINRLQDKLYKLCRMKEELRRKEVREAPSFEYISPEATNNHLEYIST